MRDKLITFWEWLKNRNYRWRYKLFCMVPLIIILLVIDWTTKAWAVKHLDYGYDRSWAPGFLNFKLIINQGSAYGEMADNPNAVIALASIITIVCFVFFLTSSNYLIIATFAVIFGGSFGNLLARSWVPSLSGTHHGVVDFLVWDFWGAGTYIFNLADLFVNIGIGLAILSVLVYVIELGIAWMFKSKHPDEGEVIAEIQNENARLEFEIERNFWKMSFTKWWNDRKEIVERIHNNKANIKAIKLQAKGNAPAETDANKE